MAVLREAADEGDDTGGTREDGAPLFEGEVRGDDSGCALMVPTDDVIEDLGSAAVAGQVAELVEEEKTRDSGRCSAGGRVRRRAQTPGPRDWRARQRGW